MLLKPKRTKFNKSQRGSLIRVESSFRNLKFGRFGLIAQECSLLGARQIEAARQVINRYLKRKGKIWIRVFPDKPITQKPLEVRQGSGKGSVEYWVAQIQPGRILFEMEGVPKELAQQAFQLAEAKLPFKVTFAERQVM